MTKNATQTGGTLRGNGRTLRIDPHGDLWIVTERTEVEAEFDTGAELLDAVEVIGYFASKPAAIAGAKAAVQS